MNLFFDGNYFESVFTQKAIKKPELARMWLCTWRDIDYNTRHDLAHQATTNNQAEYASLLFILNHLLQEVDRVKEITNEVLIHGDSQLVIRQMAGEYRVKEPDLRVLSADAKNLVYILGAEHKLNIRFVWIPREQNNEALGITNRIRKLPTTS